MLLAPETPMFFMGQEFGASSPFVFFADHKKELAGQVSQGRKEFLSQFPSSASPRGRSHIPDPCDVATVHRCRLDLDERMRHADLYRFHRDLIKLRKNDPVVAAQGRDRLDGAVLAERALVIRFFGEGGDDRLFLMNLGSDLDYNPAPEPLLAPPAGRPWRLLWSSDDPAYGGPGVVHPYSGHRWMLPANSAAFLGPQDVPGMAMNDRTP
jgi:maltooligosyltrehalose trehalohydrolase